MDKFIVYSLGILIFLPIIIGYYFDYKANPEEFKLSIKSLWTKRFSKALLIFVVYFGVTKIYEIIIPLNKNYGIEFNSKRRTLGVLTIDKNWKIDKSESNQYTTCWRKSGVEFGHFKKVIDFGILKAETETDYYYTKYNKDSFTWSIYNFNNKTFEYYKEKPNKNIISVTEKGNLKCEKPTITTKINKTEFENITTK